MNAKDLLNTSEYFDILRGSQKLLILRREKQLRSIDSDARLDRALACKRRGRQTQAKKRSVGPRGRSGTSLRQARVERLRGPLGHLRHIAEPFRRRELLHRDSRRQRFEHL